MLIFGAFLSEMTCRYRWRSLRGLRMEDATATCPSRNSPGRHFGDEDDSTPLRHRIT